MTTPSNETPTSAFDVWLMNDRAAVRGLLDDHPSIDDEVREALLDVECSERALADVLTGAGSRSVGIRWARVEPTDDGGHLHGYWTLPYLRTADSRHRTSTVAVDHGAEPPGFARWSVTRSPDESARERHRGARCGTVGQDSGSSAPDHTGRSELPTTSRLLEAIATAANSGLITPVTASGIATAL